ncbi:hypothetical protein WA026_011930 [Henosepilachna vigintioctopunctata]|uniref:Centrosomal and chromosomal factor n=1 Tax=Henosepilachna vigintioctopunctata TaxID=420089 RepID=A0AAW1UMP0_9CUCU
MLDPSISYPHHRQRFGEKAYFADTDSFQSRPELRAVNVAMATCYSPYELPAQRTIQVPVQKDYSKPLHVDCSVEYELPNTAKPPQGVRNEPLLMIHPCYFRKIESQRRSPFVNNLPVRSAVAPVKRQRMPRGQQIPQQVPLQAAQYPVQYASTDRQLWEPIPPLVPMTAAQSCCSKRDAVVPSCGTYNSSVASDNRGESCLWTDSERSPDRPEDKHILSGKYRQYLRAHRLHPYVTSAIPLASTFPQMQQVCYNV